MAKKAMIFPGSFDLLHEGHIYFYKQLLKKYDVYLVISNNPNKCHSSFNKRYFYACQMFKKHDLDCAKIIVNFGLTVEICELLNINLIGRSYLNWKDYQYELKLKKQYQSQKIKIKTKLFYVNKNKTIRSSLINNL